MEAEAVQSGLSTSWHPDPGQPVGVPERPAIWRYENDFVGVGARDSSAPQLFRQHLRQGGQQGYRCGAMPPTWRSEDATSLRIPGHGPSTESDLPIRSRRPTRTTATSENRRPGIAPR